MLSSASEPSSILVAVRCRGVTAAELSAASARHPRRGDTQFRCVFVPSRDPAAAGPARLLLLDPNCAADCGHLQRQQLADPQDPVCGGWARAEASMDLRRFVFDEVFPPAASNAEIYAALLQPLVAGAVRGFNATLFAYGQTGTGKSYTVLGEEGRARGLCSLAAADLLGPSAPRGQRIDVSFLELYNERLRDLLADPPRCVDANRRGRGETAPSVSESLDLVDDPQHGVMVPRLTTRRVRSVAALEQLLSEGRCRRTMAPTNSNEVSSRSHAIVQFTIRRRLDTTDKDLARTDREIVDTVDQAFCAVRVGKLSIVDLAGSERINGIEAATGCFGDSGSMDIIANGFAMRRDRNNRRREGSNINRSLLALGNCIKALSAAPRAVPLQLQRNNKTTVPELHVPYRDSKLTRLLKESLGGSTRTVMLATVSSSCTAFEETLSTLKYAARARCITRPLRQNAIINEKVGASDVEGEQREPFLASHRPTPDSESKYLRILSLEAEVRALRTQIKVNCAAGAKMGLAAFVPNGHSNAATKCASSSSDLDASDPGTPVESQEWALYEQTKRELENLIEERARSARSPCARITRGVGPCTRSNKDLIRDIIRSWRSSTVVQEREKRIDAFLL